MKKMKKRNLFKIAALTAVFALGSMFANAQVTTGPDYTKQDNTVLGQAGGSVKVIDNKGTVKYIQTANGLTTFTDEAPNGGVVTTFQLGGTLTSNTTLTLNSGVEFSITGLQPVGNDYQLVVIEPDGNLKTLVLSDLIDAGTYIDVVTTAPTGNTYPITLTGVTLESYRTVYVFRNGAKLMAGVDYTVVNAANSTVTLNIAGSASNDYSGQPATAWEAFPIYVGDRIEIQFIK